MLVAGLLVSVGAAAQPSCDTRVSDSRVIYGKTASPKAGSALVLCSSAGGGTVASAAQAAASATKPKESSAEQVAILRQELTRSREQLAAEKQRQHQGGVIDSAAVQRIEADVAALQRELERLGHAAP